MASMRAVLLGIFTLIACQNGGAFAQNAVVRACFVYEGPVGDHGWSYQHDQARLRMERELAGQVETTSVASVKAGPESEPVIEQLAREGCDIVFATSFGFMDSTNAVAGRFPLVKFENATGHKRDHPNVSTYSGKFHEGRYITGQIAAGVSRKGMAGYIATFPIPEVFRGINAFLLGARSVRPDFTLQVVWTDSWFDPAREAEAAHALIDLGADVLAQHTDSSAPMTTAAEKGIYAFGHYSDLLHFGPEVQLTAMVDDWSHYYIARVTAVREGTWKQSDTWHGMAEGLVSLADHTNMPEAVVERARRTEAAIVLGELEPFTGPINRQDGTRWLAAGQRASLEELLSMDFYVEGVIGAPPQ